MSFADLINQEQKKLESEKGGDKVKYPETKHKRLYFTKQEPKLLMQILPSADLYSAFALPARKVFLSARSSQGKDINSNFTLDAQPNPGSLLEQKLTEWADKKMIPNGFGGQTSPKRVYTVNAVRVVNVQGQWVQERDDKGDLAVRVFELPQSAYSNYINKLKNPLLNGSGTDLSFMDPNRPCPIEISKPAQGQMEYPVEVYTSIVLPPLPQGWEKQLENLEEHVVPTERLENGLQWVQAFIDMKEGRKPQGSNAGQQQAAPAPQANPYAQPQANPYAQQQAAPAPEANPYAQQQQQQQPYAQPQANPYAQQQQQQPPAQPQQHFDPYAQQIQGVPQSAPYAQPQQQQQYAPPAPEGMQVDALPDMGVDAALNNLPPAAAQQPAPQMPPSTPPAQQAPAAPQQTQQQPQQQPMAQPQAAPGAPAHAVNNNGLMDIDAMLDAELNG